MYLVERRVRGLPVFGTLEARLDRYREMMASTAKRRKQKDRRRDARVAAKEAVVNLFSDCSEMEKDGRACRSSRMRRYILLCNSLYTTYFLLYGGVRCTLS